MAVKEGGQHTNVEFETSLLGNHGQSLDASAAAGANSEEQRAWQKRKNIDPKEQIKLVRISHVRYQHPDLEKILVFLKGQSACSIVSHSNPSNTGAEDFGLSIVKRTEDRVWLGGYGPDEFCYYAQTGPKKFLGAAFIVEQESDLAKYVVYVDQSSGPQLMAPVLELLSFQEPVPLKNRWTHRVGVKW